MQTIAPTGERHQVEIDELFFSTTDAKGIIEESNSVFVRLSRHDRAHLIGAPHSIIRHPDMPAGAFHAMWQTLGAGKPFCAYVDNLAADGSAYQVFATITPLGTGYLSVRATPCVEGLRDAAVSLYRAVRPQELKLREQGMGAREASLGGAQLLTQLLAEAGFANYEEFIWQALPAEVRQRRALGASLPDRSGAQGAMPDVLAAARVIDAELDGWLERTVQLQAAAAAIVEALPQVKQSLAGVEEAIADVLAATGSTAGTVPIMLTVSVWASMLADVSESLRAVVEDLDALRTDSARTAFRLALARVHNDTVGQFAAEIIDEGGATAQSASAIRHLSDALREGVTETESLMAATSAGASALEQRIEGVRDSLFMLTQLIDGWEGMVLKRSDEVATRLLPEVVRHNQRTVADVAVLDGLVRSCATIALPLNTAQVGAQIVRINELVGSAESAIVG